MSVLRNIWSDLVEKKLWPVAAVLVLALVAVPVVLGGGGEEAAAPVAGAGANDPAEQAPITLDKNAPTEAVTRKGGVRDPFEQLNKPEPPPAPKAAAAAATATPKAGAAAAPTVTPAPKTGATATPAPKAATPTLPSTGVRYFTYRVGVRFGRPDKLKSYSDVKRLTALPSSTFPFFTFMGVLEDENTAVFLVAADVSATGDIKCRPSKTSCQMLELKPGDSVKLVYHPTDGRDPISYRLELKSVKRVETTSKAKAARAHAAVHRRGAAAMKAMRTARIVPQYHRYVYSQRTGLLRRARGNAKAAKVPERVSEETPWGWVTKLNGGVFFSPKKSS